MLPLRFKKILYLIVFLNTYFHASSQNVINYSAAERYKSQGNNFLKEENFKEAITAFESGLGINPKDAELWNNLGYAYYRTRDFNSALKNYNESLRLNSRLVIAYSNRGMVYFESNNYEIAIKDYTKAIEYAGKTPYLYYDRGNAYAANGEFKKAIADYDQTVNLDPAFIDAYFYRAKVKLSLSDNNGALKDINLALGLEPRYSEAQNVKAIILINLKDFYNASKCIDESIKLNSVNADTYFIKAYLHQEKKETLEATSSYLQAIKINPEIADAWNNLGIIYINSGNFNLAIENFKKAILLQDKTGLYYINLISLLARQHKFAEAASIYSGYNQKKLELEINGKVVTFHKDFMKAITEYLPQGKYNEAINNINLSINSYPKEFNSNDQFWLLNFKAFKAYALEQLGKDEEAMQVYQEVQSAFPQQGDIIEGLERLNKKLSAKQGAQIMILSPKNGVSLKAGEQQVIGRISNSSNLKSITVNGVSADIEEGIFTANIIIPIGVSTIEAVGKTNAQQDISKKITVNADRAISQKELERIDDINPVDLSQSRYHAIIIAAEKYYNDPKIPPLSAPAKDAVALQKILIKSYHFQQNDVEFLKDKNREEILESIKSKCKSLGPKDNLLIFYAGHGTSETDNQGINHSYLIPSSAVKGRSSTYIAFSEIYTLIAGSSAKHILLIADACASGAESRSLGNDASELLKVLDDRQSRTKMTSGEKEVPDNSIFFSLLINRLETNPAKYLRARTLSYSIEDAVYRETKTKPDYKEITGVGDKGGDFIFIKEK